MRVNRLGASLLLTGLGLAGLGACSSGATPQVTSVAASAGEHPVSAEPDPALDLSPVAAPENLVGIATLRSPAHSLDTLMGWTGLGLDWRSLAQASPIGRFLPIVDLDAPIDAVLTLDPKSLNRPRTLSAVSLGLSSRDAALDAFRSLNFPVEQLHGGITSVRPSPKLLCYVAPALGKAKVRLICGEDREAVELLTPYLARGIPSDSTGDAALHVELKAEVPWRLYGDKTQFLKLGIPMFLGEVSIGNPEFDAALREAAALGVDEFSAVLQDLKDVRLDVRLVQEPAQMSVVLGSDLHSSHSWVAQAFTEGEARASVAPDSFWKLPVDAREAAYHSASNPDSARRAYEILQRLAQSGLGQLGASTASQRDWPVALQQAFAVSGPMVSARGAVPAHFVAATPDARERLRASLGYALFGIDDEANSYAGLLERTLRLYEDPALRKGLAQKYGLDTSKLPKVQSKKGPARLPDSHVYQLDLPGALYASALGKDPKPVDPKKLAPLPLVLYTCRDHQRTWLAISSYPQLAEERLLGVLAPSSPEATLAHRAGLEPLGRERSGMAGFWTLTGLGSCFALKSDVRKFFAQLGPSDVPILGRTHTKAAGPSGEAEIDIPAQVFRDAAGRLMPKP
jgi:hypothetical protein